MAVRKIGISSRSVTGRNGYTGQAYESSLERDLYALLDFDLKVECYETQPLAIPYVDAEGQKHRYTPDVLIRYRRDIPSARELPHLLVEVKYRDEYRERFCEFAPKFRVARRYAREQGWRFVVLTDREIRTPYLANARFLRPYRDAAADAEVDQRLCEEVARLGETSPARLLDSLAGTDAMRGVYLRRLWSLIANFTIAADLTQRLTNNSPIWLNRHNDAACPP